MNASRLATEKSQLSPDVARCVDDNSRLIDQISADIRTMSYLFHPPLLDELGLSSPLKWFVEGFAERSKIAATSGSTAATDESRRGRVNSAGSSPTNTHRHAVATLP